MSSYVSGLLIKMESEVGEGALIFINSLPNVPSHTLKVQCDIMMGLEKGRQGVF